VQWRAPADLELPVTVSLWVGPIDGWSSGQGGVFDVTLDAEGVFRLVVDQQRLELDGADDAIAVPTDIPRDRCCDMRVLSEARIDDQTEPGVVYAPGGTPSRSSAHRATGNRSSSSRAVGTASACSTTTSANRARSA